MVNPDFVITCLGLFLIIIIALIIGNSHEVEGFEYIKDFKTYFNNLSKRVNNLKYKLTKIEKKDINQTISTLYNIGILKFISKNNIIQIEPGKEQDFLNGLDALNKYISDDSSINMINDTKIKNNVQNMKKDIRKLTHLVTDTINNYNLPIELRQHLDIIWWDCTQIYDNIKNNTNFEKKITDEFKMSYELVTYYLSSKTFIIKQTDIGKPQYQANEKYIYFIKVLKDKLNIIYEKDKTSITSDNKNKIEVALYNLKGYIETGKFPTTPPV